jgi:hypothetical protein
MNDATTALEDLAGRLAALGERVQALEAENAALKARVAALERTRLSITPESHRTRILPRVVLDPPPEPVFTPPGDEGNRTHVVRVRVAKPAEPPGDVAEGGPAAGK